MNGYYFFSWVGEYMWLVFEDIKFNFKDYYFDLCLLVEDDGM